MDITKKERWIGSKHVAIIYHLEDGTVVMHVAKQASVFEQFPCHPSSLIPFPHDYIKMSPYKYVQSARRWIANNL
jgi:hypothetical protein